MNSPKTFTLDEARALLPVLRQMLREANEELTAQLDDLRSANAEYDTAEQNLDTLDVAEGVDKLRAGRARFENSIEELSKAQSAYLSSLNQWVDRITSTGVLLRDLREGLFDFPAKDNDFDYFFCWQQDEPDINYWHGENSGFAGRQPLTALSNRV